MTNKKVEVRIDEVKTSRWLVGDQPVDRQKGHHQTAQRLTEIPVVRAKVTNTEALTIVANEPATVETFDNAPTKPKRKRLRSRRKDNPKSDSVESDETKLSCLDAAIKVLGESGEPMNTKEMIEAMESKGYWPSPGGKTPHATLYSAILRELAKGDDSRFVKTDRGRFTVRG